MRKYTPYNAVLIPKKAKRVFKGIIYDVYQWEQKLFDGSSATFEMLKRPDTIQVIAIKNNKIVILKEKQPGYERPFYGLPGGRHDNEEEDELQAAKRELLEETGMIFNKWKLIKSFQLDSRIEQFIYLFLAWDFIDQKVPHPEPGEKIDVFLLTMREVKKLTEEKKARYLPIDVIETIDELNGPEKEPTSTVDKELKLYSDGGSRGNPGPSASAYVICKTDNSVVEKYGHYLGESTNNKAEYDGLIRGLERLKKLATHRVIVYMDSELIVKQINGQYKVKNQDLVELYKKVKRLAETFEEISFKYVPRKLNHEADREVNRILDEYSK